MQPEIDKLTPNFSGRRKAILVFCGGACGHAKRLLPFIAGLTDLGHRVCVLTHSKFRREVETAGGEFIDMFASYPMEAVDSVSLPRPCRHVSFAGFYCQDIAGDVAALEPALILYDSYAVIGPAVGTLLDIPYVNICAGTFAAPEDMREMFQEVRQASVSPACKSASEKLREIGLTAATPFYFLHSVSPFLNICCELPQFLSARQRRFLEPVRYCGLPGQEDDLAPATPVPTPIFSENSNPGLRIYISFGTVIWKSFEIEALRALETLVDILADLDETWVVISLGGSAAAERYAHKLRRQNVRVEKYVDQRQALKEADIFVTHHGMNSTHEAIYSLVPMLSYPFSDDQPHRAACCNAEGLSIPLTDAPLMPITRNEALDALARIQGRRDYHLQQLSRARDALWTLTLNRPEILSEISQLSKHHPNNRGKTGKMDFPKP